MSDSDIYAAPEADLSHSGGGDRAGGNVEDAIAGNIQINMLETLGEAWRGMKGFKLKCHIALLLYFLVFIGVGILFGIFIGILAATGADESVIAILSIVVQLVITVIALPMGIAVMIMAMRHQHQRSVSAGEIFRHFGSTIKLLLVYLVQTIMIMIGLVLLVIPGIYLMFAYIYAMPLIVEKNMGIWQALETSRKAMTRVWFRFFGLLMLITLINMLGILTLGIAWIWTVPWAVLAMSMVYVKLFGVEAETIAE
ncbi:MAG: hypothetical protein AAF353_16450 [Pseudomonadota bacterium]